MHLSRRAIYLILTGITIVAGLLSRWSAIGLPPMIAKYSGSMLWGAMVYFVVASLLPVWPWPRRAASAAIVAASVEFSQLIHIGWLDAFRRTTIGVLLIGRFFSWWDIGCYLFGIVAATLLDRLIFQNGIADSKHRNH